MKFHELNMADPNEFVLYELADRRHLVDEKGKYEPGDVVVIKFTGKFEDADEDEAQECGPVLARILDLHEYGNEVIYSIQFVKMEMV